MDGENLNYRIKSLFASEQNRTSGELHRLFNSYRNRIHQLPSTSLFQSKKSSVLDFRPSFRRIDRWRQSQADSYDHAALATSISSSRIPRPEILSEQTDQNAFKLRKRLRIFFANPVKKFRYQKLSCVPILVHLVLIILVSLDIAVFSLQRSDRVEFLRKNRAAIGEILLGEVFSISEDSVLGESRFARSQFSGSIIVKKESVWKIIDGIVRNFGNIQNISTGIYRQETISKNISALEICVTKFSSFRVENQTALVNPKVEKTCANSIRVINWASLLSIEIDLSLDTIHVRDYVDSHINPDCFRSRVAMVLTKENNFIARIKLDYRLSTDLVECEGRKRGWESNFIELSTGTVFNMPKNIKPILYDALLSFTLLISAISLIYSAFQIRESRKLRSQAKTFLREHYSYELSIREKLAFFRPSAMSLFVSNIVAIIASIGKFTSQDYALSDSWNSDLLTVVFAFAGLLAWLAMLQYFFHFDLFNTPLLTLRRAFPDIFRYVVCTLAFFNGFALSVWLVYGPYHPDFATWYSTCETLFALVNGDGLWEALSGVNDGGVAIIISIYIRLVILLFFFLYFYLIIKVLVFCVILDNYRYIRTYEDGVELVSPLQTFIFTGISPKLVQQGRVETVISQSEVFHVAPEPMRKNLWSRAMLWFRRKLRKQAGSQSVESLDNGVRFY